MRVLLVDDDEAFRAMLRQLLTGRDHAVRVEEAADGEEALGMVAISQPDVVLMDLTMPRLNGVEATRRLKTGWPDLPIIILTVHDDPVYERAARSAGADGYLVKKTAGTTLWPALAPFATRGGGSGRGEPCLCLAPRPPRSGRGLIGARFGNLPEEDSGIGPIGKCSRTRHSWPGGQAQSCPAPRLDARTPSRQHVTGQEGGTT